MRLTDPSRWTYKRAPLARRDIERRIAREEWVRIVRNTLPDANLEFLELGCAPGDLSAAIMLDKPWAPFGIDYSEDATLYVETLSQVGKHATLYNCDIFEKRINKDFDVVCSFGLIEHFRGKTLDELLAIHDAYLKPGGYLIIAVPNFTGFQYVWHYLFDRPDLDRHNVDVMQPATFLWFEDRGYRRLFTGFTDDFRLWGNSGWTFTRFTGKAVAGMARLISAASSAAARIGLKLRGRSFSPYLLYIGQKPGT